MGGECINCCGEGTEGFEVATDGWGGGMGKWDPLLVHQLSVRFY
jgi:hypothetical protein